MTRVFGFSIIDAMSEAGILHGQLARQPGCFMSQLKGPRFLSNDDHDARGRDYCQSRFDPTSEGVCGGDPTMHCTNLSDARFFRAVHWRLVPQKCRDHIKRLRSMTERPARTAGKRAKSEAMIEAKLAQLCGCSSGEPSAMSLEFLMGESSPEARPGVVEFGR
jgi:hypothetical protein